MTDWIDGLGRLGYGAANLGNLHRELTDDAAWEILAAAWDSGIRYFDTAPHYGLGLSERRLGAFLQTKPRDEFVISTKVGRLIRPNPAYAEGDLDTQGFHVPGDMHRVWDLSADGVAASLDESRERLGLDRIDVVFVHDPESHSLDQAIAEAIPALVSLREAGVVSGVGVGTMNNTTLERAARETGIDISMLAGRYTLLDEDAQDAALPACREGGSRVVAASVFNSGLLASDAPSRDGRYQYGSLPEVLWERLQVILSVCRNHDVRLPAAAIQFPLREQSVCNVVVGGSRPAQLRENVELMSVDIPEEFWDELDQAR
ncbi:aldo/keto reductase [Microbacterium sp. NPDC057650]|uniref:aldo/keto reductase n=1 Tax=unclassified Microbacterium TaxID=2609290 RepID=UPI00366ED438